MASDMPQARTAELRVTDFRVSELAAGIAGAASPYGDHQFPLPVSKLRYTHPSPSDRPNLADGR